MADDDEPEPTTYHRRYRSSSAGWDGRLAIAVLVLVLLLMLTVFLLGSLYL